jgi:FAD:protein FMN transferase
VTGTRQDVTTGPHQIDGDLVVAFRAMATTVNVRVVEPTTRAESAAARVEQMFADVERACTRFNPQSPLMLANAAPKEWHVVPQECFEAISEAARAYDDTEGRFDPRVLKRLQQIGYDRTLAFADGNVEVSAPPESVTSWRPFGRKSSAVSGAMRDTWMPKFDARRRAVMIGPEPIDLGGIGKGLAVRWAAELLAGSGSAFLVEAGGDCYLSGNGPEGDGWRVAVEDPAEGPDPLAVLNVDDVACATSSVRIRSWLVDGKPVHHLIDPRTGEPGGAGLAAVTVVGGDPAWAEVWSKSLFLAGRTGIRTLAEEHLLAALWVTPQGRVGSTAAMKPYLMWQAVDD